MTPEYLGDGITLHDGVAYRDDVFPRVFTVQLLQSLQHGGLLRNGEDVDALLDLGLGYHRPSEALAGIDDGDVKVLQYLLEVEPWPKAIGRTKHPRPLRQCDDADAANAPGNAQQFRHSLRMLRKGLGEGRVRGKDTVRVPLGFGREARHDDLGHKPSWEEGVVPIEDEDRVVCASEPSWRRPTTAATTHTSGSIGARVWQDVSSAQGCLHHRWRKVRATP
mmetsp:Transcript_9461/g.23590  ORF Transcript_9461/g.23590 Transcript_9461/m.23590 type:complete len:221 (-) Transcript_9461:463-1125(-)